MEYGLLNFGCYHLVVPNNHSFGVISQKRWEIWRWNLPQHAPLNGLQCSHY